MVFGNDYLIYFEIDSSLKFCISTYEMVGSKERRKGVVTCAPFLISLRSLS